MPKFVYNIIIIICAALGENQRKYHCVSQLHPLDNQVLRVSAFLVNGQAHITVYICTYMGTHFDKKWCKKTLRPGPMKRYRSKIWFSTTEDILELIESSIDLPYLPIIHFTEAGESSPAQQIFIFSPSLQARVSRGTNVWSPNVFSSKPHWDCTACPSLHSQRTIRRSSCRLHAAVIDWEAPPFGQIAPST